MTPPSAPMRDPPAPPPLVQAHSARAEGRFLMQETGANLWFEPALAQTDKAAPSPHARDLIISFDNLATIDEGWPRGPWAMHRLHPIGAALLGVQSLAKDWFRLPAAPSMLRALAGAGFFDQFDHIVMVGASMGGFAALNFAPLVPRARVLAFSPQSTMNKTIAPFEARFPFAVRKSNWHDQPFLDAAAAVPYIPAAALLYDPYTPEDALHAARLRGPHVQCLPLRHATHEAIRVVIKSGAFTTAVQDMLRQGQISPQFWAQYRARKAVPKWQRALLQRALDLGHLRGALRAGERILAMGADAGLPPDDLAFVRRACREARQRLGGLPATAAVGGGDKYG